MTSQGSPYRAPRDDNSSFCKPSRSELGKVFVENQSRAFANSQPAWIKALRTQARLEVTRAAVEYAGSYLPNEILQESNLLTNLSSQDGPAKDTANDIAKQPVWIIGGHQPELFHPGVWYKNFLIDSVAKELRAQGRSALGLHVIIDHDLAKSLSIKVPSRRTFEENLKPRTMDWLESNGTGRSIITESIRLPLASASQNQPPIPWHLHRLDPDQVPEFLTRLERGMESLGLPLPMARNYFRQAADHSSADDSIAGCSETPTATTRDAATSLSVARHWIEAQHGLRNIDLPMGRICETEAWFRFVERCLERAQELSEIYNQALLEYREQEKITNPGQPVPSLGRDGDWVELPFWLYRLRDSKRSRMWVREQGCIVGSGPNPNELVWTKSVGPEGLVAAREAWLADGVCLRPRALMTTLFLRCFLADGFVHGIGGGVYDRLTDTIIARFLGIEPPSYAVATATLHLNLAEDTRRVIDGLDVGLSQSRQRCHDLRSRPERFLDLRDNQQSGLASAHAELLRSIPPRGQKKEWHHRMVELKREIRRSIEGIEQSERERYMQLQLRVQELRGLLSREYSMVLFGEDDCISRLKRLSNG